MSYTAQDVSVLAGDTTLLAAVTVRIPPGGIVVVAGPNGAGKSTLIAVLAGDRRPRAGSVTLAGRPLGHWPRAELAQRRAVMGTSQDVAFDFSVEEVALLGRLPLHGGDPGPQDRDVVRELLASADCAHLAERSYASLSSGERQRVQLVRAIAQVAGDPDRAGRRDGEHGPDPERYLLLDEPTSSLDPAHQHAAMSLLREQAMAGRGVLAVLHDLNLAAAYADHLVLLSAGRVAAAGPPADVLRPETLESVFAIPMLVIPHPRGSHPLVVPDPPESRPDPG
jgi:iron complex transport system ATP-binding protein